MCVLAWHRGVAVKRIRLIAGVCAALAVVAGSSAFALEEQRAPAVPQTPGAEAPAVGVQDGVPQAKPETGTEIRIPGLGKLGTLPKMDFGLELLYGASDAKAPSDPIPQDQDQDLMIRGSVKHRF